MKSQKLPVLLFSAIAFLAVGLPSAILTTTLICRNDSLEKQVALAKKAEAVSAISWGGGYSSLFGFVPCRPVKRVFTETVVKPVSVKREVTEMEIRL